MNLYYLLLIYVLQLIINLGSDLVSNDINLYYLINY